MKIAKKIQFIKKTHKKYGKFKVLVKSVTHSSATKKERKTGKRNENINLHKFEILI